MRVGLYRSRVEKRRTNVTVEDFAKLLSEKYNLSERIITKICRSEFLYVNEVMKQNKFESIRLMYFGLFGVSKYRLKYISEEVIDKVKQNGAQLEKNYPDKKRTYTKRKKSNKDTEKK